MTDSNSRWGSTEKKLKASIKFPKEFDIKVDMSKVRLTVIKPWVARRVTEILDGLEDEVVIEFILEQLEEPLPDPRLMQINLTGFLEKNTGKFMLELWRHLVSAQSSPLGIPEAFVEEKKNQVRERMKEEERTQKRVKEVTNREYRDSRRIEEVRQREREERRRKRHERNSKEIKDRHEGSGSRREEDYYELRDRTRDKSRGRRETNDNEGEYERRRSDHERERENRRHHRDDGRHERPLRDEVDSRTRRRDHHEHGSRRHREHYTPEIDEPQENGTTGTDEFGREKRRLRSISPSERRRR